MKYALVLSFVFAGALSADDHPADCPMHAQHTAAQPARAPASNVSPYVDAQDRGVKALSDEQIKGYTEGLGMGFAVTAELNHYPGPRHVLDAASELALSPAQKSAIEVIHSRMQARAVSLGAAYVTAERDLDAFFEKGGTDPKQLAELSAKCGTLLGQLRDAHLEAHIETRAVLTPAQIAGYDRLRGYEGIGATR
jgi:Spy/CpxP family protein refolding chaperone